MHKEEDIPGLPDAIQLRQVQVTHRPAWVLKTLAGGCCWVFPSYPMGCCVARWLARDVLLLILLLLLLLSLLLCILSACQPFLSFLLPCYWLLSSLLDQPGVLDRQSNTVSQS